MTRTGKQRLSRPLYEGLPWIYVAGGAVALVGSYFCPYRALSIQSAYWASWAFWEASWSCCVAATIGRCAPSTADADPTLED